MWIGMGLTDMGKGMHGLALIVQQSLKPDPYRGDLFVFRSSAGSLVKLIWHDGISTSLMPSTSTRGALSIHRRRTDNDKRLPLMEVDERRRDST